MKCIHRVLYVTSIEIYEIYQTRRQSQTKSVSIDGREMEARLGKGKNEE